MTINICLKFLVGGAMYLLDMPTLFSGVIAGLLNFILTWVDCGNNDCRAVAAITFDNPFQIILHLPISS
jgi:hypothetical protein